MDHTFGVISGNSLHNLRSQSSSAFLLKVHGFTFYMQVYFQLIFYIKVRYRLHSIFLPMDISLFWHITEKTILSSLNCLCNFVKNQLSIYEQAICELRIPYSVLLLYMVVHSPVLHCFNYCSFYIVLKVDNESSDFILFSLFNKIMCFQICM